MVARALALGLTAYLAVKGLMWLGQWDDLAYLVNHTDHAIYMGQAHRILAGGPLYQAFQFAPYDLGTRPEMYPALTVYGLIVPMSLLPDVLWWAIPIAIVTMTVWYWRPSTVGLVAILLCLCYPHTWVSIAASNPVLWMAALVSLATRWPAFGPLAIVKPSLFPFALVGIRHRSWWLVGLPVAIIMVVSLPDYLRVLSNAQGVSVFYSLENVPLLLIPVIARHTKRPRVPGEARGVSPVEGGDYRLGITERRPIASKP